MGKRRQYAGTVVSAKMQKTVIVRVASMAKHPKYDRILKRHNTFKVHDEKGIAKAGDLVRIEETRPLSKEKRFRVTEVLKKAPASQLEIKEETA
jgi:small subunit ribosomal protein S17